jgi:hypothetical protein
MVATAKTPATPAYKSRAEVATATPSWYANVAGVEMLAGRESYASLQRDEVLVEPLEELRCSL